MAESGEILFADGARSTGGRPAQSYRYNPDYAHILSLYASSEGGQGRIVCAASSSTGESLFVRSSCPIAVDCGTIESAIAAAMAQDPLIKAIGMGVPGIVHRGTVGRCDIPSLQGLALAARIQDRFGAMAIVENDMNLTAYGYYRKHARELDSLAAVMLPRGNGPGTGIVVDGRILRGHSGFAGEVHYLPENYNPLFQSSVDGEAFLQALARMLATIAALVDPQRILLTGALVNAGMLEPLERICRDIIPPEHCPELAFQGDCSAEYLEGLRLKAHESLRYQYRLTSNE
jgi:predicted NBD/HSP70 family sugar kinase